MPKIGGYSAAKGAGSWISFLSLYLLYAGSAELSELVVGSVFASLTLLAVARLGKGFSMAIAGKASWLALLGKIPWAMVQETWLLAHALARQLRHRDATGIFVETPFPGPDDAHDPARRAFMAFGVCITPNSYLVFHDREKRQVLIRQLVGRKLSDVDRKFVELP